MLFCWRKGKDPASVHHSLKSTHTAQQPSITATARSDQANPSTTPRSHAPAQRRGCLSCWVRPRSSASPPWPRLARARCGRRESVQRSGLVQAPVHFGFGWPAHCAVAVNGARRGSAKQEDAKAAVVGAQAQEGFHVGAVPRLRLPAAPVPCAAPQNPYSTC